VRDLFGISKGSLRGLGGMIIPEGPLKESQKGALNPNTDRAEQKNPLRAPQGIPKGSP